MKELLKILPVLKMGCRNAEYPLHAKHIISTGTHVITHNGDTFVMIDYKLPFTGGVNIYILNTILKNLSDEYLYDIDDNMLRFFDDNYSAKLVIDQFDLSDFEEFVKKNEEVVSCQLNTISYDAIKLACNFTGVDDLKFVVLKDNMILSTNRQKVFFSGVGVGTEDRIAFDPRLINFLSPIHMIGTIDNNTVINFDGGFLVQSTTSIYDFPVANIISFVERVKDNLIPFMEFNKLKEAMDRIFPMSIGEIFYVSVKTNEDKINVRFESEVNGIAEVQLDRENDVDVDIILDGAAVRKIEDETYYAYLDKKDNNLILKSDKYLISLINVGR